MSEHISPDAPALPPGVPDAALAEYAAGAAVALTDSERWPSLSDRGFDRLESVRRSPSAPRWVHECGDRLVPADHERLRSIEADLETGAYLSRSAESHEPAWLAPFLDRVQTAVPRYRAIARLEGRRPRRLEEFAPVSRDDLTRSLSAFVPVDVPLDRVLEGSSSGSTGAAVVVPLHPVSTATEVVLFQHLAARAGVLWEPDPTRMALANVVDQRAAFTYVSMLTALSGGEAPMARVNLHPSAWRELAHRAAFLTESNPQVISSSPLALLELAGLGLDLSPLVLFSGATHLTPAARQRVHATWGVPVVDVYGSREAGLIAADLVGDRPVSEHVVLPRRVHVEILDAGGSPVPDGEIGEVTVTVDDNPYLPLVRYRTGDTAALRRDRETDGTWRTTLLGLEGRSPVRFLTGAGSWVPSIDATQVLQAYGVAAWHLHQRTDGSIHLTALVADGAGRGLEGRATDALGRLVGQPVTAVSVVRPSDLGPGSKRRFTSDIDRSAGT
ncbi:AMP-binding protein [Sanguibacter sp. 25GB23B1]|uniref:AMP-binding protein n=1 Tax=unclassified Sanguibacter TaxID=2645534 RepID=UPI0032AFCD31